MNNRTKLAQQTLDEILKLIEEQGGIVKKEQFTELGIDYRRILDFVQSGDLVRIKNGYYTDRIDRFTEEELVARLFSDARLCMESALYAYGYISQKPYAWHLAVDKNTSKSRFKMDYPKIIPYYTEPDALELGSTEITMSGQQFLIYDRDRVICDCLKYETKLEREVFKGALQSYIRDSQKDISALMAYARARKVVGKVQSMIGVWL
ncbi:MAG: type IV toxin-antitoxin system AbiEi family antitoxin domain-containing protein [Lachnobacterium sp.]|nr:type IV toxin-antitoxin system AbiEi family antitoxin domain-containing protein [Lachnobacterium sp.]MCI7088071.1 type IV toxin-antitoxin system AbiEi family antitoxin domain-containing protein [Lachnobacterium sp.]MDD7712800.1 type IV toxin-antitoxin system AbiEi family antitoxin domain-containing protein [Lachnobacterium sp.]MDY5460078.1 type IV toxin-antitoxin system AbiEi family antitoxin domain-containing protein [Agathobacter sp.]